MGRQSQSGGGKKVDQVDPLGQVLRDPGKGGHINKQQCPAPDPKAGEYPSDQPREKGGHQTKKAVRTPA